MDAQLRRWLVHYNQLMEEWRKKDIALTPEIARDGLARLTQSLVIDIPDIPLVNDHTMECGSHQIPLRIYHPAPPEKLPVFLYLHGGGHMAGSIEVYEPICRKLALATGRIVISVDYRLAPEHPYPQGLEDVAVVLAGCLSMLDTLGIPHSGVLALGGDSAGGAMSATLACRQEGERRPPLEALVLIYPSLDYTMSMPSMDGYASGYLLEKPRISWYFSHYFQNSENLENVSPLFMPIPAGFPRTLIVTAGYCPLRDEGLAFAKKLEKHNIPVQHLDFAGMVHAFLNLESLVPDSCRKLYTETAAFLNQEETDTPSGMG